MQVNAIQCSHCNDIIYSRARHDFHYCSCGSCFIDGGFDYTRYGANDLKDITDLEIEVDASTYELFEDWNKSINKFGTIKNS